MMALFLKPAGVPAPLTVTVYTGRRTQLLRRVVVSSSMEASAANPIRSVIETRTFSNWGRNFVISAPPEADTITITRL